MDLQRTTLADGRYRLVNLLGEGGMAAVYRCWDERLHVYRAVKVLKPNISSSGNARQRFENEARAMARIRHRNVLTVHDFGGDREVCYIVMEFEEGGSLSDHVRAFGPLPPRQAVSVTCEILDALQAAHDAGIVHRDIKPQNVLLSARGEARVADFGISRLGFSTESMTATGSVLGTFAFMAPEQLEDSKAVDHRADLYAAGATLYVLLTRRRPRDLYNSELAGHVYQGVPSPLVKIIRKATAFEPETRFRSAAGMAKALRDVLGDLPPDPPDTPALGTAVDQEPANTDPQSFSEGPTDGMAPDAPSLREETPPMRRSLSSVPPTLTPEPSRHGWVGIVVAVFVVAVLGGMLGVGAVAVVAAVVMDPAEPVVAEVAEDPPEGEVVEEPEPEAPVEAETEAPVEPEAAVESEPEPEGTADPPVKRRPRPRKTVTKPPEPEPEPEPVVEEPPPEPEPPPPTGKLWIMGVPPGQVYIDGELKGEAPVSLPDAPVGSYRVEIRREGYPPVERTLEVREGLKEAFCWDFKAGAVCPR